MKKKGFVENECQENESQAGRINRRRYFAREDVSVVMSG